MHARSATHCPAAGKFLAKHREQLLVERGPLVEVGSAGLGRGPLLRDRPHALHEVWVDSRLGVALRPA